MAILGWLDAVPAIPRRLLITGTAVGLAASSALDPSGLGVLQQDAIALGVVLAAGGAWLGVWGLLARPELQRRRHDADQDAARRVHDHGLIAASAASGKRGGVDALSVHDPAFSLPVFHEIVRALAGGGDLVRINEVRRDGQRTTVVAYVEGPASCRRVTVSRAADATSPPPDADLGAGAGGWALESSEDAPIPDDEAIPASSAMPAARRALLMRAEAFDLATFEALLGEIDAALDQSGETAGAADAYTTPAGQRCLGFWLQGPGLPPRGEHYTWLEVEEDGWYERIEVRSGRRVLGLLRPSGSPEAPWRLWRVRRSA